MIIQIAESYKKMMQINYTNICANGSKRIIVDITTEICVRSELSLSSPNHRNVDEADAFVF